MPHEYASQVPGKEAFHRRHARILRGLAKDLGLGPSEFDVRSNKAGPAVLGEVILHTDHLYLMVGGISFGPEFMYRSCKSRKDYGGGANQWARIEMLDPNHRKELLMLLRPVVMGIPSHWPAQPLRSERHVGRTMTCGSCGLSWDDSLSTALTPVPSGRCPFEPFHKEKTT